MSQQPSNTQASNDQSPPSQVPQGSGIGLLVKPVSADCNLTCEYCFYHRSTDPYSSAPRHRMSDEVLEAFISQYMRLAGPNASIGWQGGEPLMAGIDFFKKAIEFQKKYGFSGQTVGNGMQTNATLVTPELARLFQEYNFLAGVSLDGPKELHDHYRRTALGKPSYDRVMRAIDILREHRAEFNILSVVNNVTGDHADEIYDFLATNGFDFMQFIPCVEVDPRTGDLARFSVGSEQYGKFLCRIFDKWYGGGQPTTSVRFFENVLMVYAGVRPEVCEFHDTCGRYVVIEHNGDVYPCDFFVEDRWYLGNLLETPLAEIASSAKARFFASQKQRQRPECNDCEWHHICRRGCPRRRYVLNERFEDPFYLCEGYKQFFAHADSRFRKLAEVVAKRQEEERRSAEERAARLAATSPAQTRQPGRNEPCPCGSGKKYKKCCMHSRLGGAK